jgi:ubiquinone/menaquinone biosynthesis C-methylase UbiE
MSEERNREDLIFPIFPYISPFRHLVESSKKFCEYVKEGQSVVDLGCGPGYFTIALAEAAGSSGKVFAVDIDEKALSHLRRRVENHPNLNVEVYEASATELNMIEDETIDFILAYGLLCSMTLEHQELAIKEMKRILKPDGKAYLTIAKGPDSYVDDTRWQEILKNFKVEKNIHTFSIKERHALVSKH